MTTSATDGPIARITPSQLQFVPEPTDFQSILDQELGNLGTDQDGFDILLSDTIALLGEAGTVLTSFDPDLTDAGTLLTGLDSFDPASDQAGLVPVAAAIDAALNDYNQQLPPQPNTGSTGGTGGGPPPPTGPQPGDCEKGTATDFPGIPASAIQCVPDTLLRGRPSSIFLGHSVSNTPVGTPPIYFAASLESGDPTIWSITTDVSTDIFGEIQTIFHVTVAPLKRGRFKASIRVHFAQGDAGQLQYFVTRVI